MSGSKVACSFAIPPAPGGQALDLSKVAVAYTPGDGSPVSTFPQAMSLDRCTADTFYIATDRIALCPEACVRVQADDRAKVDVLFTCQVTVVP